MYSWVIQKSAADFCNETLILILDIIDMYYVYILACGDKKHMKIGMSSNDLTREL